MAKRGKQYVGLAIIGDPHVEGRQPGFRCDDYPNVILEKLRWCFSYARTNGLLPVLLGDFFDKPRDNPTWMLCRLIELMQGQEMIGIFGNHDCAESTLTENDSLSILVNSGCLKIVSADSWWRGQLGGRPVAIGGSSYREPIPQQVPLPSQTGLFDEPPLVIWLAHHDIPMAEDDGIATLVPHEIANVDLLVNGHIHRRMPPARHGQTLWVNPGNISRRTRGEATQSHVPSLLQVEIVDNQFHLHFVEVPHEPFDQVFHESAVPDSGVSATSAFVDGLMELQARRTQSGAGLLAFLEKNLEQFDGPVAEEIRGLAREVTQHG